MSFAGFSITASALAAYQAAENVTANNIANVNTPGASAQVAQLQPSIPVTAVPAQHSTTNPGTIGTGVTFLSIQRLHDNSLDTLYRTANSSQNYYTAQNTALTTLQAALNEPSGGVSEAFSSFRSAIAQLASETSGSNSDSTNRQAVLKAAQKLATALNLSANAISTQQTSTINLATSAVQQANEMIDKIAVLNGEIRASSSAGDNPNTYLDQRDHLVDQLSAIVPVQTTVLNNGSTLITVGGQAVVNDTTTYHLNTPTIVTGSDGTPQLVVGRTNDPDPTKPIAVPLGNGTLGGLVDLYNQDLSSYKNSIDAFAASTAQEFNSLNQTGYDQFGQQGGPLFASSVGGTTIGAADIAVAITGTSQIAAATASTSAGKLTQAINISNSPVSTSSSLNNNPVLANSAGVGGNTGTLTINVNGLATTYNYNTAGADATIGGFVNNFNALQTGVTASFDQTSQKVVFLRDAGSESQQEQARVGYTPTASFTITDSQVATGTQPASGVAASGILDILGAGKISGVQQNASNAFGANSNTNAVAFQALFSRNVGVPPVTNHSTGAIATGSQTVPLTANLGNLTVGQILTIDPGTASEESVLVTGINDQVSPQTFTATFAKTHTAGAAVVTARKQTLSDYYGSFVTQLGFDGQAAATGTTTQTNLTSTLQTQRSSSNGINLDQETQNLIKYQSAYTAAAKTFSVLQSLLTAVIATI